MSGYLFLCNYSLNIHTREDRRLYEEATIEVTRPSTATRYPSASRLQVSSGPIPSTASMC